MESWSNYVQVSIQWKLTVGARWATRNYGGWDLLKYQILVPQSSSHLHLSIIQHNVPESPLCDAQNGFLICNYLTCKNVKFTVMFHFRKFDPSSYITNARPPLPTVDQTLPTVIPGRMMLTNLRGMHAFRPGPLVCIVKSYEFLSKFKTSLLPFPKIEVTKNLT